MRRSGLRLVTAALLCAGALAAAAPAQAAPQARWYTLRWGPVTMGAFGVKLPKVPVRTPDVDGWITYMNARLVDRRGRPVSIRSVMLHHIVFLNHGRPGEHRPGSCVGREGEPFYGTGEEHEQLRLPPGYGYRIAEDDRWTMQTMLMSHSLAARRVYVQYTDEGGDRRAPAAGRPVLDPRQRLREPEPQLPGLRRRRARVDRSPHLHLDGAESGRLVAAGGHLHGGAQRHVALGAALRRAPPARHRPASTAADATSSTGSGRSSTSRGRSARATSSRAPASRCARARS